MIKNCIGDCEFEISDNWDNIPTNNFFLSASRCVVGSSKYH